MTTPKKKPVRKKLRQSKATKPAPSSSRLAELAEVQEILLPELAARIMEKGLCSYNDPKQALAFIDVRRSLH